MRSSLAVSICLSIFCAALSSAAEPAAELAWPEVTSQTRPWAYWWWMGSAVEEKELARDIEQCRKAGYGGLHAIPIYGAKGYENRYIEYLSPRWLKVFASAVRDARRQGMDIDTTTGTGWCFGGGPLIAAEDGGADVVYRVIDVPAGNRLEEKFDRAKTQALVAYCDSGRVVDLTGRIAADGSVDWQAIDLRSKTSNWRVYELGQKPTEWMVKRAAPGGEGPMLNSFSVRAMRKYLKGFDEAFSRHKGPLPRAMYHDSYEYRGNWSPELLEVFQTRRGYRLEEHLPALFGKQPEKENAEGEADAKQTPPRPAPSQDEIARVRTDYNETLADMHLAYIRTWAQWAKEKGCETRNQAHGSPSNLLDTYAVADIPETEMFGKEQNILMSKFASSAAHVAGRRLVGAETGTWLGEHFTVTLDAMKVLVDKLFISGANHVIYHGTCYSPAEAKWPGWVFYASTQMNSRNAIWRDVPTLNAYITRCQSILQSGRPDGDLLLYWPLHDQWHSTAGLKPDFTVHNPWNDKTEHHAISRRLFPAWQFDHVSDRQLAGAKAVGSAVTVPGGTYHAVVVPACGVMPETTFQRLIELARDGATVIFEKHLPADVPGLGDLENRRARLKKAIAGLALEELPRLPGVRAAGVDKGRVLVADDVRSALRLAGIRGEPLADHSGLWALRRTHAEGRHYFIFNSGDKPLDAWVPLATELRSAVLMDPMTGKAGVAALHIQQKCSPRVYLQLAPNESCILRTFTDKEVAGQPWKYLRPTAEPKPVELAGLWNVEFTEGGPELPPAYRTDKLESWTLRNDDGTRSFAGTARYTLTFDAPPSGVDIWMLDLGEVCHSARVRLNGGDLSVLIGPNYRIELPKLKPTGNRLEVEVTNLSANRVRDLDRRGVDWKIFHNINIVNGWYQPFDASAWPIRPSGLLGPVRLLPYERAIAAVGSSQREDP